MNEDTSDSQGLVNEKQTSAKCFQRIRTDENSSHGSNDADNSATNGCSAIESSDDTVDTAPMTLLKLEYVPPFEVTTETSRERDLVTRFVCDCKQADGLQPCSSLFSVDTMMRLRNESKAIDYYENHTNKLDLVVLGILRALVSTGQTTKSQKKKPRNRQRNRTTFLLNGQRVCEKTFLFAHAMSEKRYKRLTKIFKENGMVQQQHGNTNRPANNSLGYMTTARAITFIQNYAEQKGLFLPGQDVVKPLPTSDTKTKVYDLYKRACENDSVQCASLVTFRKLWMKYCPEIVIQKSKS